MATIESGQELPSDTWKDLPPAKKGRNKMSYGQAALVQWGILAGVCLENPERAAEVFADLNLESDSPTGLKRLMVALAAKDGDGVRSALESLGVDASDRSRRSWHCVLEVVQKDACERWLKGVRDTYKMQLPTDPAGMIKFLEGVRDEVKRRFPEE